VPDDIALTLRANRVIDAAALRRALEGVNETDLAMGVLGALLRVDDPLSHGALGFKVDVRVKHCP
jgi:hypothetical protein